MTFTALELNPDEVIEVDEAIFLSVQFVHNMLHDSRVAIWPVTICTFESAS